MVAAGAGTSFSFTMPGPHLPPAAYRDKHVEIIDLLDTTMKYNVPSHECLSRYQATGGLLQNQPIICGGRNEFGFHADIFQLQSGPPGLSGYPQMLENRCRASSVVLDNSRLFITGGCSKEDYKPSYALKSTAFISIGNPPVQGPDLPFTIYEHSMVQVDKKTIFLIGGCQNGNYLHNGPSKATWIMDPTNNFQIKCGPPLNEAKSKICCNKMKINGKLFLVVVGGAPRYLGGGNNVQLLDTTSLDKGWIMGKTLLWTSLFRNKRFILDEITQQNASTFAIFLEYLRSFIILS